MELMIDIETLGLGDNAVIAAIGAATFDIDGVGTVAECYNVLDVVAQPGRSIDASTAAWWLQQSDEARYIFQEKAPKVHITQAIERLKRFSRQAISTGGGVWANAPDFDLRILSTTGFGSVPYYQHRDVRTVRKLLPTDAIPVRNVAHNALEDVRYQVGIVQAAYRRLRGNA